MRTLTDAFWESTNEIAVSDYDSSTAFQPAVHFPEPDDEDEDDEKEEEESTQSDDDPSLDPDVVHSPVSPQTGGKPKQ